MNHTMATTTGVIDHPLYNISLGYVINFGHILIHVYMTTPAALTQVESIRIFVKLPDILERVPIKSGG